ncbi:MAG: hypothetical protein U1E70_29210 [Acetobacteraceae bacterium]
MAEALVYFAVLALYSFVLGSAALLRHELLLLATIPPVFVAMIMGFVMGVYAADRFGDVPVAVAVLVGLPVAWLCTRRFGTRDMLIGIYLAWSVALVLSLVAFGFPDAA